MSKLSIDWHTGICVYMVIHVYHRVMVTNVDLKLQVDRHTHICGYMRMYVYICVYMCIYAYICVYMCIYVYICVYMCIHVCICVYMCIYMYISSSDSYEWCHERCHMTCVCVIWQIAICIHVCICVCVSYDRYQWGRQIAMRHATHVDPSCRMCHVTYVPIHPCSFMWHVSCHMWILSCVTWPIHMCDAGCYPPPMRVCRCDERVCWCDITEWYVSHYCMMYV